VMVSDNVFIGSVTLESFLLFLFTAFLTVILGDLVYIVVRRALDGRVTSRISKVTARAIHYTLLLLGLYLGIHYILGEDLTALAASLGIVGVAVAFSSQQIIQNIMAGLLISVERPIQHEDWIEIGGSPETGVCKVRDITLTTTVLRTANGRVVYLPNSVLLSSKIVNYTKSGFVEIPVTIAVPYTADLAKITSIMLAVANENTGILPNVPQEEQSLMLQLLEIPRIKNLFDRDVNLKIFEPKVLVSDISGSKLMLSLRIWIREINRKDEIVSDYVESLWKRLRDEQIVLE
jgi:small conductance mechanosensitive channel